MLVSRTPAQCGPAVCVHFRVLLHPFIITSIGNDWQDECLAVWCGLICASLGLSAPNHDYSDQE